MGHDNGSSGPGDNHDDNPVTGPPRNNEGTTPGLGNAMEKDGKVFENRLPLKHADPHDNKVQSKAGRKKIVKEAKELLRKEERKNRGKENTKWKSD